MSTLTRSQKTQILNPYDGTVAGEIETVSAEEVKQQISVAHKALDSPLPEFERAEILEKATLLLTERAEKFAQLITAEAGKPITIARSEVARAQDTLRYSAITARTLVGEVVPLASTQAGAQATLGFTIKEPVGVVAAITPFNFPLNLCCHKLGPAIAAGCPIVHKPASSTPLTARLLHQLLYDAGLPENYLHLATGAGSEIGPLLTADRRVKHISFTGSSSVGWRLYHDAKHARVSLELGNSTPLLIFSDSDLDAATDAAVSGGFGFAGQSCIAVQRVLVENDCYDEVCTLLRDKVAKVKSGNPADEGVICGPVIDDSAKEQVLDLIENAKNQGAQLLVGGGHRKRVIEPTLLVDVAPDAEINKQELFGPALAVSAFGDEQEAINYANGTEYGLQAGVFTQNTSRALRLSRALKFGGVTINMAPTWRVDQMPYGGIKESGNTKEGPAWAVRELLNERLVVFGT